MLSQIAERLEKQFRRLLSFFAILWLLSRHTP